MSLKSGATQGWAMVKGMTHQKWNRDCQARKIPCGSTPAAALKFNAGNTRENDMSEIPWKCGICKAYYYDERCWKVHVTNGCEHIRYVSAEIERKGLSGYTIEEVNGLHRRLEEATDKLLSLPFGQIAALTRKLAIAEQELTALKFDLEQAKERADKAESDLFHEKEKLKDFAEAEAVNDAVISMRDDKIKQLESDLAAARNAASQWLETANERMKDLSETQAKLAETEAQLSDVKSRYREMEDSRNMEKVQNKYLSDKQEAQEKVIERAKPLLEKCLQMDCSHLSKDGRNNPFKCFHSQDRVAQMWVSDLCPWHREIKAFLVEMAKL